jgi:hypothetical protein
LNEAEAEVEQHLYRSITVYNDLSEVPETTIKDSRYGKSLTVQNNHLSFLQKLFERNMRISRGVLPQSSFKNLNCPVGYVSEQSVPDAVLMSSGDPGLPLGLVKVSGARVPQTRHCARGLQRRPTLRCRCYPRG